MMARPELWTLLALCCAAVAGFGAVAGESRPVLFRQKRDWIWNSLYVEEEKPAPVPYKIGQLKSTLNMEVKRFRIDGDGANDIFTVDHKGDLFVTKTLDREKKSVYHLSAQMFDGNNVLVEDSGRFEVIVNDINDNIPQFPSGMKGSITERSPEGTEIVVLKATDADDPTTANGLLHYSLVSGGDGKFKINGDTGMLSCSRGDLDRETVAQYVLVVKAQDMRGKPSGSTATTSVTIEVKDINDNIASFVSSHFEASVPENHKLNEKITILKLEDRDELRNKLPSISVLGNASKMFDVEINSEKDGNLILTQHLDYETKHMHVFEVRVFEKLEVDRAENNRTALTTATVRVKVLDVDEPPVFNQTSYTFTVEEGKHIAKNIGSVHAEDPDKAKNLIRYSIWNQDCPFSINPRTGMLSARRPLDRELEATHMFQVKAQEDGSGLETFVQVDIIVKDVNDNVPELIAEDIFVCENDRTNTVLGTLRATDKDEQPATFSFSLASPSSNFSIRDHGNNSADVLARQGPFSLDDARDYSVKVRVGDGGIQSSETLVVIKACRCDHRRVPSQCKVAARRMGVSVHALIAILLCILTILVIVILFVMRKRYQKEHLSSLKHSGEIHEQLVTYDEEGGGEMDTNGYDVSILTSACHDGSLLCHPESHPRPSLYAMVQKPHHHHQPSACKGDMAAMIEDKKFEADHDRDGFPYDTLHIYGYEGPESLAGSLSSLDSSSSGSNLDYDFLNDWGPRFRTLAELYGVNAAAHEYYHQY